MSAGREASGPASPARAHSLAARRALLDRAAGDVAQLLARAGAEIARERFVVLVLGQADDSAVVAITPRATAPAVLERLGQVQLASMVACLPAEAPAGRVMLAGAAACGCSFTEFIDAFPFTTRTVGHA